MESAENHLTTETVIVLIQLSGKGPRHYMAVYYSCDTCCQN